ncbi:MAG: hypothetical protein LBU68_01065 [Rickettsiales bacterium]|jgi:hypothetical protein|nr:hypothetical protein [Rickettsiales bacterium]
MGIRLVGHLFHKDKSFVASKFVNMYMKDEDSKRLNRTLFPFDRKTAESIGYDYDAMNRYFKKKISKCGGNFFLAFISSESIDETLHIDGFDWKLFEEKRNVSKQYVHLLKLYDDNALRLQRIFN